jgi:Pro-kumamolisin, activation domain/Bacterial Ig-like domain (group 3)
MLLFGLWLIFSAVRCSGQAPAVPARITVGIDDNGSVTLPGNVHPLARAEFDRGIAPDAQVLHRMLLLLRRSPDQETALIQLLDDQQSKVSPNYHKWLTPAQFGQQFGPADTDIQAVTQWLTSRGLTDVRVGAGRTVIEFSGSVVQVRNAFSTEIHKYVVKGETHLANAGDPQIPTALAPIIAGIVSLNNFPVKSHLHRLGTFQKLHTTGEIKPLFTFAGCQSGNCFGVGPADFATIYNSAPLLSGSPKIDGTGQTIAIVGESNINIQDIVDVRTMFGLAPNFTANNVILNGPDPGINGSESEADVDVEWSGAAAPGATINFVVSAPTETTSGIDLSALYIIDNNFAGVMSESFGACEKNLGTTRNQFYNSLWEQAAAQGITVVLSAGDAGSAGCDDFDTQQTASNGLAVSGFASTPFDVAVSGTDFDQAGKQSQFWNTTPTTTTPPVPASALKYIPEVPWNDSCAQLALAGCGVGVNANLLNIVAGSGGASSIYPKPTWQMGVSGVPADSHRDLPDVALFAGNGLNDSFYIMCQQDVTPASSCNLGGLDFSFQGVGGTSVSAPAFAGIMALVNQKQATSQVPAPRQGVANQVLYALAKKQASSSPALNCISSAPPVSACTFNDIAKGNNAVPCAGKSPNCSSAVSGVNGVLVETGNSSTPAFPATPAYDLATGLGSINASNLANNWNTVNRVATTVSLILNNNNAVNITHGSSVPVQVTLTPNNATGDVSLVADLGNGKTVGFDILTLGAGGSASGTTTALPGGTSYLVYAHYTGDGSNAPSHSAPPVSVTVNPENSKTFANLVTQDIDGKPTGFGATGATYGSGYFGVRLDVGDASATVSPSTGIASNCSKRITSCPTGTIAVTANGAPFAGGSLSLNGEGFAEESIPPGAYSILASYPGDSSYGPSSGTATFTIVKAPTTIVTGPAGLPVQYGGTAEIDGTVTTTSDGVAPTGTFVFLVDGVQVAGPVPIMQSIPYSPSLSPPYAWAVASARATFLSLGQHTLTTQYSGDSNYAAATGTDSVTVMPAVTTIVAYAIPASVNVNQQVMLNAQVSGSAGVAPTGTITFVDGSKSLNGTVSYTATNGLQATMPYTPTTTGVHDISATYSGDANYLPPGTSVAGILTVMGPDFTLTPQVPGVTVTAGKSATYTIAVTGANGFNSSVTISCSVAATAAACTPSATNPASVAVGSSATVTVTTTGRGSLLPIQGVRRFESIQKLMPLGILSFLLLALLGLTARNRRQLVVLSLPATGILLLLLLEAAGCGGGAGSNGITVPPPVVGTPPGSYTVTITGTAGTATHTTTTTLIVN